MDVGACWQTSKLANRFLLSLSSVPARSVLLTPQQRLREAVLLAFCDPMPSQSFTLLQLSPRQWQSLLRWLDISGLALYLYDRLAQFDLLEWLPPAVEARLRQNLADNTQRTHRMLAECIEIQERFREEGFGYALLKGFSLVPCSLPRPELRSQLDLDFLIAADAIGGARRILEDRGYVLHAISGRSWEFKTTHPHAGSLRDLYKDHPARSIELHVEAGPGEAGTRIANAEWRDVCGFRMSVLAPVPLFLGQAAHLYKHVSTGFFRCSHLLELYRHIVTKSEDVAFWSEVRKTVTANEHLALPLGVTTLLLTRTMGSFAPEALMEYAGGLPAPVRLWTETIGPRCVYSSWPGTKLHLLLQRELSANNSAKQTSLRRALVPRRLPPAIAHAPADETLFARMRRSYRQVSYIFFRLRYHTVAGVHYAWELARWKRLKQRLVHQQNVTASTLSGNIAATDISETNKRMTIL